MLKEKIIIVDNSTQNIIKEIIYQRIKIIGQGTFGKAKRKKDGKQFALKEVLQDKKYKNRQLSIIARIQHCNIIHMKQYFLKVINDECYLSIVMDYIPSNLGVMIKENRKLKKPFLPPIRKILSFQLFKALYYMQLTKVCHRDLKPPNILIDDKTFQLKICDFGSAKILQKQQSNVAYICSRYYRAPQLVLQATDYHTQIDVWSAGCIIVQFLTLQPIFPGDSSQQQLIQIMKILGTPPTKYIQLYQIQKKINYNLPNIKANEWGSVLRKYSPQRQLVDLIQRILIYNGKQRLTPFQALTHPYFSDLAIYKDQISKLPNLFYFGDLQNHTNSKQIDQLYKLYPSQIQFKQKNTTISPNEPLKIQKTPQTNSQ